MLCGKSKVNICEQLEGYFTHVIALKSLIRDSKLRKYISSFFACAFYD
jgi:hypothetical protein